MVLLLVVAYQNYILKISVSMGDYIFNPAGPLNLTRCLAVICSSARIHLAECKDWSLIQVTPLTGLA